MARTLWFLAGLGLGWVAWGHYTSLDVPVAATCIAFCGVCCVSYAVFGKGGAFHRIAAGSALILSGGWYLLNWQAPLATALVTLFGIGLVFGNYIAKSLTSR